MADSLSISIANLASEDATARAGAAGIIYRAGRDLAEPVVRQWRADSELASLLGGESPRITVGVAVEPVAFARIRAVNGSPLLARVPPTQDAAEFELDFSGGISLDILTTNQPGGSGAIARFLAKFGKGIQQVEYRTLDVDRATQILREKFGLVPVYPETRPGAGGAKINFFLVSAPSGQKVLIELYETSGTGQ